MYQFLSFVKYIKYQSWAHIDVTKRSQPETHIIILVEEYVRSKVTIRPLSYVLTLMKTFELIEQQGWGLMQLTEDMIIIDIDVDHK